MQCVCLPLCLVPLFTNSVCDAQWAQNSRGTTMLWSSVRFSEYKASIFHLWLGEQYSDSLKKPHFGVRARARARKSGVGGQLRAVSRVRERRARSSSQQFKKKKKKETTLSLRAKTCLKDSGSILRNINSKGTLSFPLLMLLPCISQPLMLKRMT